MIDRSLSRLINKSMQLHSLVETSVFCAVSGPWKNFQEPADLGPCGKERLNIMSLSEGTLSGFHA